MMNLQNRQDAITSPIGVFDSGVGGLSVLRSIREQMPEESVLYFGDQGHVPYGPRSMGQIQSFSAGITRFLLDHGSKLIVVACNTASAAALTYLRESFPGVSFVGMEPAVKPAAETTKTGRVGVLATPATFQGALYASVVERFGAGVELFQHTCPGLVSQIEKGELDSAATRAILEDALHPMLEKNIDTVVLGCTHYPFVIPLIQEVVGGAERVRVIDPAPSVAKQAKRLLEAAGMKNPAGSRASIRFFTSGDVESMKSMLPVLLGEVGDVELAVWQNDEEVK
ncbi:MAG TPA: glutamate racemase [Anaerolineales bacterium]|nr:glutamate racemase [Anaerolineales bacterium]HMX18567.1 glutamate racemase [Anaerolineales bacterium]HMZ44730.1 glutamate racemase [Anaerolineales bacterium]HNB88292.1 glutamate racemase [Anaerolineales bacterium]HNF36141.1 glutamate racemase [Anaerolineales bacterium]